MLKLLGKIYGAGMDMRNALYDRGVFASHTLGARTISIGNITTGGTGKTPLVTYVAEILAEAGEKVCILTRGYGRAKPKQRIVVSDGTNVLGDARIGGDEPVELARKLIGKAIVVADADRVSAAAWAKEKFGVTAFVLDDGFQHRRVKSDLDIVCVDATNLDGGGSVLPAGTLREPFANLSRADAIVITRANLVDSIDEVMARVRQQNPGAHLFTAEFSISRVVRIDDFLDAGHPASTAARESFAFAFCALGNPGAFGSQLRAQDFDVRGLMPFADHHRYEQSDIKGIEFAAASSGSEMLITTAKDAVKLRGLSFTMPCFVAEIEVVISDPDGFQDLVLSF